MLVGDRAHLRLELCPKFQSFRYLFSCLCVLVCSAGGLPDPLVAHPSAVFLSLVALVAFYCRCSLGYIFRSIVFLLPVKHVQTYVILCLTCTAKASIMIEIDIVSCLFLQLPHLWAV